MSDHTLVPDSPAGPPGAEPVATPPGATARFRPDIQGLRAIAVLTVIAAHSGLGVLTGGFVGVDVFFVISGFLITQQLVGEVDRSGNASLVGFYSRRARRILPAATLVLVATVVASALFLSFLRLRSIAVDALWSACFAANIRFANSGVDYFAQDLPPSPLQHFWSLSVEEQFYLVWPLVVIGVVFLVGRLRRRTAAVPVGALLAVITLLSAASFAWSVHDTAASPTTAYFSTFARAWELGLGAIAGLLAHRVPGWLRALGRVRWLTELVAVAGIVAIAWSCLRFTDATPFPGTLAMVPVGGAAAVLLVGAVAARPTWIARLLSVAPARVVGDWSYSLYLWHWPILIIAAEHLRRELTAVETVALVALTFVLSGLTYRFVETPFRSGVGWFGGRAAADRRTGGWLRPWTRPPRALVLYPVSLALVAGSAIAANAVTDYRRDHRPENPPITLPSDWRDQGKYHLGDDATIALVRRSVWAAQHGAGPPTDLNPRLEDVADSVGDVGECNYGDDVRILCRGGDTDADKTLVVVGNSHGRHWIPAIEKIARHSGYATYYLVKVQCTAALVTPDLNISNDPFEECADFHAWMLEQVDGLDPDLVIVSSSGTDGGVYTADGDHLTDPAEVNEAVADGFGDLFDRLEPLTDRLVLLDDVPMVRGVMSDCIGSHPDDLEPCLDSPRRDKAELTRLVGRVADQRGVARVRTAPWFCYRDRCPAVVGDTISYRDAGHMTNEYSERLAAPLGQALQIW